MDSYFIYNQNRLKNVRISFALKIAIGQLNDWEASDSWMNNHWANTQWAYNWVDKEKKATIDKKM